MDSVLQSLHTRARAVNINSQQDPDLSIEQLTKLIEEIAQLKTTNFTQEELELFADAENIVENKIQEFDRIHNLF